MLCLQAAAAAAELAALEAAPAPRSSGRIQIDSFEKFERSSKRQRDGAGAEQEGGEGQHKHKHHRHHGHGHSHQHEAKQEAPEGAGAADVAPDGKARATKQLSDFVKVIGSGAAAAAGVLTGCRGRALPRHLAVAGPAGTWGPGPDGANSSTDCSLAFVQRVIQHSLARLPPPTHPPECDSTLPPPPQHSLTHTQISSVDTPGVPEAPLPGQGA